MPERGLQLECPAVVPSGAQMAGGVGHALFAVNRVEHQIRVNTGRGAITALHVLHKALEVDQSAAPFWDEAPLQLPGVVVRVEVQADDGRKGLDRAMAFRAVAPVTVVTLWPRRGLNELRLEADALGVGLEVVAGDFREILVEPYFEAGRFDAASWAFHERAYRAWLRAGHPAGSVRAGVRRARSAA